MFVNRLFGTLGVVSFFYEGISKMLMVPDLFQILTVDVEGLLVVWVDSAKASPKIIHFLSCSIDLFPKIVQDVQIWDYGSEMSPELYLHVAYLLYRLLHLSEEPLELNDVCQLGVYMLRVVMLLLDIVFNDILVSEDGELLLQRRLLLDGDVQLNQGGWYVFHVLEEVERECYVD